MLLKIRSKKQPTFQLKVQKAVLFPVPPLSVSAKSNSSTLVFLTESGNAAKRVNAFWADVAHIDSHLHLEELFVTTAYITLACA